MTPEILTLVALGTPIATVAATVAAVRVTLNGAREDIRDIRSAQKEHGESLANVSERLVAVETRLEDRG